MIFRIGALLDRNWITPMAFYETVEYRRYRGYVAPWEHQLRGRCSTMACSISGVSGISTMTGSNCGASL